MPPLRYDYVYRLKQEFPHLTMVINGGIKTSAEIRGHLERVDGVMLGREAYHNPYWMATFDRDFFNEGDRIVSREAVEAALAVYVAKQSLAGVPPHSIARHTLGLYRGLPGARAWRRSMSQQPSWAA